MCITKRQQSLEWHSGFRSIFIFYSTSWQSGSKVNVRAFPLMIDDTHPHPVSQARVTDLKSCVVVLRIFRDMCNRLPQWQPLKGWVGSSQEVPLARCSGVKCLLSATVCSLWSWSVRRPSPPVTVHWVPARLCVASWSVSPQGSSCQVGLFFFLSASSGFDQASVWGRPKIFNPSYQT